MEEKSLKRILILGSAVIDVIVTIDRLPLAGEDIPGLQKGMLVGGCAFNVSKILDGLQIPHDLCVPVGQGMYADRIREALHEGGHEILIEDDREDNGYCLSLVEKDGERTFISIDGIETKWHDAWLERLHAADYDYLYASGYGFQDGNSSGEVLLRFLCGKKADAKLILDPGPRLLGKQFEEKLLQMGTILKMNQSEAKAMGQSENVRKAAENLHHRTGQPVIITMGHFSIRQREKRSSPPYQSRSSIPSVPATRTPQALSPPSQTESPSEKPAVRRTTSQPASCST